LNSGVCLPDITGQVDMENPINIHAVDPVNAVLNLGYGLLAQYF
jgi:CRISPR/Cas system-associated endonuclease Cas1